MLQAHALRRLNIGPIDLKLEKGTCLSIEGKSGSGKSVLLRMIADLDPHDGEMTIDSQACSCMSGPAWRRQVTYVPAESGWWADDVHSHFAAGTDFAALLPALGIPAEAASWPVSRLSTGERQRLSLLRAIGPATRVLLLDEPTSGLDVESVGLVEAFLKDRLACGVAILMVTHDPDQAERMACRRLMLSDGLLKEQNP